MFGFTTPSNLSNASAFPSVRTRTHRCCRALCSLRGLACLLVAAVLNRQARHAPRSGACTRSHAHACPGPDVTCMHANLSRESLRVRLYCSEQLDGARPCGPVLLSASHRELCGDRCRLRALAQGQAVTCMHENRLHFVFSAIAQFVDYLSFTSACVRHWMWYVFDVVRSWPTSVCAFARIGRFGESGIDTCTADMHLNHVI